MGCGPSETVAATHPTVSPPIINGQSKQASDESLKNDLNQRRTSTTSHTSKRIRINSAASIHSTTKRVTSASSKTTTTDLKSSTVGKQSRTPSLTLYDDANYDLVIIWVDPHIIDSEKTYVNSLTKFRRITDAVFTFNEFDQCIHFLDHIYEKTAFLIVSDSIVEQFLPLVIGKPHLDFIYILNQTKRKIELVNAWKKKVKGLFDDIEEIFKAITADSNHIDSWIPMSILPKNDIKKNENEANELNSSFMYMCLLTEILLKMQYDYKVRNTLSEFCRGRYLDNEEELNLINEFEQNHKSQSAVYWYTRDCFLYKTMNFALRTQDMEIIMKMGFFIRDLHEQLATMYKKQVDQQKVLVFRGQGILLNEFDKIRKNIGGLISFNVFLSTSTNIEISLNFAKGAENDPKLVPVLFRMHIDPTKSSVPFADVTKCSSFSYEKETLFSMHTIFRIVDVRRNEGQYWNIILSLTSDTDPELMKLTDHLRQEIGGGSHLQQLGNLMLKMGKFDRAKYMFTTERNITNEGTWFEQIRFNHQLGYIFRENGEFVKALSYYEKALDIQKANLPKNHSSLAPIYNNIASVCYSIGDFSRALSFYKTALDIELKSLPSDHRNLSNTYNNLGSVHCSIGDYSIALQFFTKTLGIRQKTLPDNHPDMASIYNNIGSVYNSLGEYTKALAHYQKAIDIQEKTLLSTHIDLATSYSNIGITYNAMGDHEKALESHKKALEIRTKSLLSHHPDIALSYNNIGSVEIDMGHYTTALWYLEKALEVRDNCDAGYHVGFANVYDNIGRVYQSMDDKLKAQSNFQTALEIRKHSLDENHPDIANSYNNLGAIYNLMEEKQKAIEYCEKALVIQKQSLSENHPSLANTYNNIGLIYHSMKDNTKALTFCQQALALQLKSLPEGHPSIATTYNNIGLIHNSMKDYPTALSMYEKVLSIQQNAMPVKEQSLGITYYNIGSTY
ncbi:unnamed protein product, partial [Rotaria socialis]